jgi:Tfp pilus assembly protein PilX
MIVVLGVMLVTSLLLVATFTAASGEIHLTGTDRAQRKAYYAAEAGIQDYEYHLTQDGNYLSYCTSPTPANPALNQFGASPLSRATVPSTNGEPTNEQYAIQLLPAESSTEKKCNPNNLVETMLEEKEGAAGTFRIESTGYSGGEEKTLVATFRNANFVSYVWYTKYETGDPSIYGPEPSGKENWFTECGAFYGVRPADGGTPHRCRNNFFINGESVNGPMHTEDHAGVCGSPVFGRYPSDRIEFGSGGFSGDEGFSNESVGCTASPTFKGTHIPVKEVLSIEPPPGDEELKRIVEPSYLFEGKTEIILEGSTMTVKKHVGASNEETIPAVAYPPNGVIYVAGGCGESYSPFGPKPRYTASEPGAGSDSACGNVYVHGEYTQSLTIVAENDVVINKNLTTPHNGSGTPTSNALLGLIANNFVRVYHPVLKTYVGHAPEFDAAAHKETVKIEAKTAALAKELKVEIKELTGGTSELILFNTKTLTNAETPRTFKKAEELLAGPASSYVTFKEGAKYNEGKGERLKAQTKYLNEACNKNGKSEVEKFNATVDECEYTIEPNECNAPNNTSLDLEEPTVYAAMLAVKHAVIVDNFNCGSANLKNLNVYGAVAGLYTNGFTGEFSGSSIIHGYPYNANYDNRLQIEEPPHFLNPIQAAWYIQRQSIAPNP